LARMFLLYAVVTRACADPRVPIAILKGMAAGLLVEAVVAVWQRFGLGILQVPGTVGHQNLLGLLLHLVSLPAFALALVGRGGLLLAAAAAGILVDVLTTSRGNVGLGAFGYSTIFIVSALRKWTARKAAFLAVGVVLVIVIAPLAFSSFERRFAQADAAFGSSEYDERAAFERAASMMLSDNPMGHGANNYVVVANTKGYNAKAGVAWVEGSEGAHVHNIYWLVAAETGYPGIIAFVLLLIQPLIVAFHCGWRNRGDQRGDLLLGLGVALLVTYIHGFFEWVAITFEFQYLLALTFGMTAGLALELGYWRRPDLRGVVRAIGMSPRRPTESGVGLVRADRPKS
jgi:O-antigen ligase